MRGNRKVYDTGKVKAQQRQAEVRSGRVRMLRGDEVTDRLAKAVG